MYPQVNAAAGRSPVPLGMAPVFAALGDETRLQIIGKLSAGGVYSITQLTEGGDITRQAITKHLNVLAQSGLVRDVKVGRERRWQWEPDRLNEVRQALDRIAAQWEHALGKLKAMVEDEQ